MEVTPENGFWGTADTESWYVVTGEVIIGTETAPSRVQVDGDVHLILADGCRLTVNGGIGLSENANITIYGQQAGTGTLTAITGDNHKDDAGIGSNEGGSCGNITINGGTITATSEEDGAGIGSGQSGTCEDITINGGTITATSKEWGAGIGSGCEGTCEDITINGGTITATSKELGAGIGNGDFGSCSLITISGGTVYALSGEFGDGHAIGNADDGAGASFSTGLNGSAVIYATLRNYGTQAIIGMENKDDWNGIFFLNNEDGLFCGDTVQPTADFEIPADKTLTIGKTQTLIIPEGMTMTVTGNIVNNGTIICYGKITGEDQITGNPPIYPQPDPEPTPEEPEEEEEEVYIPSEPIPDGLHEYSLGTMLYRDGKRVKGLTEYEGAAHYFDRSGWMQTGWVELEDGWRYFGEDGKMVTGWLKLGNVWYYLDPETGLMLNDGLHTIGKSTYYFYGWGGMANDWWYEDENGDWYFFGGSGAMKAASWVEWKGEWYYLTESGKMAV